MNGSYGTFLKHNSAFGLGAEGGVLYYFPFGQLQTSIEKYFSYNWFLRQTHIQAETVFNLSRNVSLFGKFDMSIYKPHSTNTVQCGLKFFF